MRGSRRNRTPAAGQSSGGSSLLTFLALAVIGAFIFAMIRRENERAYQQHEAGRAVEASRGAVFARGDLTETLELCSEGWQNRMGLYHTPIAIAWTRTGWAPCWAASSSLARQAYTPLADTLMISGCGLRIADGGRTVEKARNPGSNPPASLVLDHVQAALLLGRAGPPAGPLVLALADGAGARPAADAGITPVV